VRVQELQVFDYPGLKPIKRQRLMLKMNRILDTSAPSQHIFDEGENRPYGDFSVGHETQKNN
jgi:hypothetical protein